MLHDNSRFLFLPNLFSAFRHHDAVVACAFDGNAFQVVQALTTLVGIRWCLDAAHFAHFIDLLEQAPGRYLFVIGCASEGNEQGDSVIVVVVEYREEDLWRIFPRTFKRFECVASLEGISADVLDATVKLDALEVAHAIEARTVQSFHVFWYFHFRDFFVLYKQAVGAPKRIDAETDIEPLAQIGDDDLVHSRKIALRNESKGAWKV